MPENSGIGNEALKALIKQMIKEESGEGSLTLDKVYPVGSIYMSMNNVSPATFIGGTWTPLDEGRVLIGANSAHPVNEKGGNENHAITVDEMPSHNHSGDLSGSTGSAGAHSHSRGTMNITGSMEFRSTNGNNRNTVLASSGAFNSISMVSGSSGYYDGVKGSDNNNKVSFNGASGWSGSTYSEGSHSHSLNGVTITTTDQGGGKEMSLMQPYLSVYMWKRTA